MPNPTFKELLEQDVKNVFLNPEEFGEIHKVDDREMVVVIDDHELREHPQQAGQHLDGIYAKQRLIYVAAADFGPLPVHGAFFTLDDEGYTVVDAVEEGDMYAIAIEANESR